MKLNKRSSQPLYAQLKDLLQERIESGFYGAGEQIPSEQVLCKELDLSRPTVRQAIAELVSEGYLEIIKGKGTFVAAEPSKTEIRGFSPFTFSLLAARQLEDFQNLTIERVQGDAEKDQIFELSEGAGHPGYWSIRWQMAGEDGTLAVCHSLVPIYMFPELAADLEAERRMFDITANKYAYLPQKASARLMVRTATRQETETLEMDRLSQLLIVQSKLKSRSGNCCEYVTSMMRSDAVILAMDAGRS